MESNYLQFCTRIGAMNRWLRRRAAFQAAAGWHRPIAWRFSHDSIGLPAAAWKAALL